MKPLCAFILLCLFSLIVLAQVPDEKPPSKTDKPAEVTKISPPLPLLQRVGELQQARNSKLLEREAAQAKVEAAENFLASIQMAMEIARRDVLDAYQIPLAERPLWSWQQVEGAGWVLLKSKPPAPAPDSANKE